MSNVRSSRAEDLKSTDRQQLTLASRCRQRPLLGEQHAPARSSEVSSEGHFSVFHAASEVAHIGAKANAERLAFPALGRWSKG
eukprot:3364746-Rhodomonas_salina.1